MQTIVKREKQGTDLCGQCALISATCATLAQTPIVPEKIYMELVLEVLSVTEGYIGRSTLFTGNVWYSVHILPN